MTEELKQEAEEYADRTRIKDKNTYISFPDENITEVQDYEGNRIDIRERIEKAFKDGAEFGYNKANEWHYVSKGDLPKNENRVWLYFGADDYNDGQFIRGRFWCDSCGWFDAEEVIAWQTLTPPEEIKEND